MTIYKGGKEQEKITLHTLKTKADMHAMFKKKEFRLLTSEEQGARKDAVKEQRDQSLEAHKQIAARVGKPTIRIKHPERAATSTTEELLEMASLSSSSGNEWKGYIVGGGIMSVVLVGMVATFRKRRRRRI